MKYTLSALTFIAACLTVSTATARIAPTQDCQSNAECPEGYSCVLESVESCPGCVEEEACPPCETETFGYCQPPPPEQCASDADCDGDNVCVSYTYSRCDGLDGGSGGGDQPVCNGDEPCGAPDPEPEPTDCEEFSEAYCVAPYYAPCQIDADCGSGFTCEDLQLCSCSSDTNTRGDQEIPEPDCECAPTGDKYCELIYVNCEGDGDCSGGLECYSEGSVGLMPPLPPGDQGTDDGGGMGLLPEPDEGSFCAPGDYAGRPSVGNSQNAERLSWGDNKSGDSSGSKGGGGCTTAEGNASLGIFGLFALIALRLRR